LSAIMTLVVKAADAARLIDMEQAIKVTESVLAEQARGQVAVHPPFHLPVPGGALNIVETEDKGAAHYSAAHYSAA